MLKPLFFALLFFAVLSCSDQSLVEWEQRSLTEEALEICAQKPCPEITVNYLLSKGKGPISTSINSQIKERVIKGIWYPEENTPTEIEEAMQEFIFWYRQQLAEFPDSASTEGIESQIEVIPFGQLGRIASIEIWSYVYLGGAHGMSHSYFLNFDLNTGDNLSVDSIIQDQKELLEIAEQEFRKQKGIPKDGSLNEQGGFWFEQDQFHLPETAGISLDGLIFMYDQYDIASFADGRIEFTIPLERIEHLINRNLL